MSWIWVRYIFSLISNTSSPSEVSAANGLFSGTAAGAGGSTCCAGSLLARMSSKVYVVWVSCWEGEDGLASETVTFAFS